MKKLFATAVVGMMIAVAMPTQATESVFDRNVRYLLEQAGFDEFPTEVVAVEIDGQIAYMTGREVFEYGAETAGDLDLAAMAESALPGGLGDVGDMYLVAFRGCKALAPRTPTNVEGRAIAPQVIIRGGDVQALQCAELYSYNFITKTSARWPTLVIFGVIRCYFTPWWIICYGSVKVFRDP